MRSLFFSTLFLLAFVASPLSAKAGDAAYAVALVSVKDPDKMAEYVSRALPILEKYQGEVIVKGPVQKVLSGDFGFQSTAIAKFPNVDAIDSFYTSEAYQALVQLRGQAADVVFFTINEASND